MNAANLLIVPVYTWQLVFFFFYGEAEGSVSHGSVLDAWIGREEGEELVPRSCHVHVVCPLSCSQISLP